MNKKISSRTALLKYLSWAFFYFHLALFIGINSLLIITNLINTPGQPWFVIPLSSWGIFLLMHFIVIFLVDTRSAKKWRNIKIRKDVLDKLNLGLTNEELFQKTTAIFFARMIFYLHLGVFLGGSLIMILINYFTDPNYYWSAIVIMAWSIWLLTHFFITHIVTSPRLLKWRTDKIKSLVYREYTAVNKKEVFKEAMIYFGFWIALRAHLGLFLLSNLLMVTIDYLHNTTGQHWFYYPLASWGIFLLAQWLLTYLIISPRLAKWRQKNIQSF